MRIISEPEAAFLATGQQYLKRRGRYHALICDLGGRSFDLTLLEITNGLIVIKSTDTHSDLGGELFTDELVRYCAAVFKFFGSPGVPGAF